MKRIDVVVSGGCQCGAVRYRATAMLDNSHLCHCRMCQKAVGNIFAALVAAPADAITWTRGKASVFMSSAHVARGFCNQCGTPLFYNDVTGTRVNFTIGSLDNPAAFPPSVSIGLESLVPWYRELASLPEQGPTGSGGRDDWSEAIRTSNRQHPDHDTQDWPKAGE